MKKKILFRADGNSETGLGHLYRLFALVEMYKDNYDFVFVTRFTSTTEVIPSAYPILLIPQNISIKEEPNWLAQQFNPKENILIADGYHFDNNYQKKIKELGFKLMYIDDLTSEHMFADIVVNHSPNITKSNYSSEKYTKFALGTNYAILRPEFLKATLKNRTITKINTAFVCFGGADMYDLSLQATKALLNLKSITEINVVLGGAYKHKKIFILNTQYTQLNLHENLSQKKLCDLMKHCNFGVVPSSTILYELCAVKMPILSGYFVDNQQLIYQGFLENNVIFEGGNFLDYNPEIFQTKIAEILKKQDYSEQCENQKKFISKDIRTNFINLLKNQL